MGYYTQYDITDNDLEVREALVGISGYEHIDEDDAIKWYSCEKDMKEVSKMFPDKLITVSGIGEENGDVWVSYAKNGKVYCEKAKIVLEPFNESKLK